MTEEPEVEQETKTKRSVMSVIRQIMEDEGPGKLAQIGETVYRDTDTEQGFTDCTTDIERKAAFLLTRCARKSGAMSMLSSFITVPQATAYKCTPYAKWLKLDEQEYDDNTRFINNHWEPHVVPQTAVVFADGLFDFSTGNFKMWQELGYKLFGPRIMLKFEEVKAAKPTDRTKEFERTLETVMPDAEARLYFQKVMGHVLQPHVNLKKGIFIQGPSGSRKTTMATAITCAAASVGGFSIETIDDLADNRFAQANLINRFANLSDDPDGKAERWVGWFKRYTGSSIMRGEFKKVQAKNFPITAKLIICCNRIPNMGDASDAVWSRLCVFNFQRAGDLEDAFVNESADNEKLHTEYWSDTKTRAWMVGWLMDGLAKAHKEGMTPPQIVKTWNKTAAGDADPIRKLFEENYEKGGSDDFVPTAELKAMLDTIGISASDYTIKLYMQTMFATGNSERGQVEQDGKKVQMRGYKGVRHK